MRCCEALGLAVSKANVSSVLFQFFEQHTFLFVWVSIVLSPKRPDYDRILMRRSRIYI